MSPCVIRDLSNNYDISLRIQYDSLRRVDQAHYVPKDPYEKSYKIDLGFLDHNVIFFHPIYFVKDIYIHFFLMLSSLGRQCL